jgi:hypothetical protein
MDCADDPELAAVRDWLLAGLFLELNENRRGAAAMAAAAWIMSSFPHIFAPRFGDGAAKSASNPWESPHSAGSLPQPVLRRPDSALCAPGRGEAFA